MVPLGRSQGPRRFERSPARRAVLTFLLTALLSTIVLSGSFALPRLGELPSANVSSGSLSRSDVPASVVSAPSPQNAPGGGSALATRAPSGGPVARNVPSGTDCPGAQVLLNTTEEGETSTPGVQQFWASSYPVSEAGEWLTGYALTAFLSFDDVSTVAANGTGSVHLELTTTAYAPWGTAPTSVPDVPAGVPVQNWSLSVAGGSAAGPASGDQSCLGLTVPGGTPYLTIVVGAYAPSLSGLAISAALSVGLVPPGGAHPCDAGTEVGEGSEEAQTAPAASKGQWAASDPTPLTGATITGFDASLAASYVRGTAPGLAYTSVEAYLVLTAMRFVAWNSSGQGLTGFPQGATVVGVLLSGAATTGEGSNVALASSCLDLVVPSSTPYLSLLMVAETTTAQVLTVGFVASTYLLPAIGAALECGPGTSPQYGAETDPIPSGGAEGGLWAASDPVSLSGSTLEGFEVGASQAEMGAPQGGTLPATTRFALVLTPSPFASWNSSGQAIPYLPSGGLTLGAWVLGSGSIGDTGSDALYSGCLSVPVGGADPYLTLIVNSSGPAGLLSDLRTVAYFAPSEAAAAACPMERTPSVPLEENETGAPGTSTVYAASLTGSFAGQVITGLSLSSSVAGAPGTLSAPSGTSLTLWVEATARPYPAYTGNGTGVAALPPGTVLATVRSPTGAGFDAAGAVLSLACLSVVVPESEPYLTVVLALVAGEAGSQSAVGLVSVNAEPPSQVADWTALSSMAGVGDQAGGDNATLASAGHGGSWVVSDPTALSGRVLGSISLSATLLWGNPSSAPALGEARVDLFLTSSPFASWAGSPGGPMASAPPEPDLLGSWALEVGSQNLTASLSSDLSDGVVPVPLGEEFLSVAIALPTASPVGLQARVEVAVVVATPAPVGATVAVAPPSGDAGATAFAFSDVPTGGVAPYRESWRFGDGSSASGSSVAHVYARGGSYAAQVWTNDSLGASLEKGLTVTVSPLPAAAIQVGPTGPWDVGETLNFSAIISGGAAPISLVWKFGDGSASIFQNTTHAYRAPGSYVVRLFDNDSAGESVNSSFSLTIYPSPSAAPFVSPATPEVGSAATFYANASGGAPPFRWAWTFGDGGTASSENATHTYLTPGTYSATLFLNDSAGLSVARTELVVVEPALHVSLTVSGSGERLDPSSDFLLSASPTGGTGTYRFAWTLNGSSFATTTPAFRFKPTGAGTFSFVVEVVDSAGLTASASGQLTVLPALLVSVLATPENATLHQTVTLSASVYAPLGPVNYTWSFLPAPCTAGDVATITCAPAETGSFAVEVTVEDSHGYQATGFAGFVVRSPPSSPTPPITRFFQTWGVPIAVVVVLLVVLAVALAVHRRRRPPGGPPPSPAATGAGEGSALPVPRNEGTPPASPSSASVGPGDVGPPPPAGGSTLVAPPAPPPAPAPSLAPSAPPAPTSFWDLGLEPPSPPPSPALPEPPSDGGATGGAATPSKDPRLRPPPPPP